GRLMPFTAPRKVQFDTPDVELAERLAQRRGYAAKGAVPRLLTSLLHREQVIDAFGLTDHDLLDAVELWRQQRKANADA
ncbi:MAG: hypothetical protein AAFY08_12945, partial [Planctomycetota bacterium]